VTAARSAGLEIADLLHRFGNRTAVDGLTADVRRGEVVGLVGRNGAGKTTTMRAIMGILQPTGGAVRWAGHAVTHADRLIFGYMPEERGLYPQMGVLDQLMYFARLHGLEAMDARRAAQEWLGRLDLRGRELDRVVALSHGNQQRVQLAVALVHGPELLVLDEPFSGLDPTAVDELSRTLRTEAVRGAAVLFSSHQLELVEQLCDRVVILEEGRMIASGTLAELRASLPQQLRVKVDSGTGWTERLTGVSVMRVDEDGVLLRLERRADPQVILKAAMAAGAVEHFGFEAGTLADVYRELMSR
jgi:ABC-2 type transport system ATP-binding protein